MVNCIPWEMEMTKSTWFTCGVSELAGPARGRECRVLLRLASRLFYTLAGSPYNMGYAHGELMKERATGLINDVWNYLEEQVVG